MSAGYMRFSVEVTVETGKNISRHEMEFLMERVENRFRDQVDYIMEKDMFITEHDEEVDYDWEVTEIQLTDDGTF